MSIDPVRFPSMNRQSPELDGLGGGLSAPAAGTPAPGIPSFGEALDNALQSVSRVQSESDEATRLFALGKDTDLHTVLIQVEKADLAFRTLMEVRNKLLDAYREVMRMQI